jgi:hypothetical protein
MASAPDLVQCGDGKIAISINLRTASDGWELHKSNMEAEIDVLGLWGQPFLTTSDRKQGSKYTRFPGG